MAATQKMIFTAHASNNPSISKRVVVKPGESFCDLKSKLQAKFGLRTEPVVQLEDGTIIEDLDEIEPGDVLIAAVSEAESGVAAAGPDFASATAAIAAKNTRESQPDPLFSGIARRLEARERATTISGSLKMLRRILENTAKPEPKFRRIPFTNEKVRSKLGNLQDGLGPALLEAAGFERPAEGEHAAAAAGTLRTLEEEAAVPGAMSPPGGPRPVPSALVLPEGKHITQEVFAALRALELRVAASVPSVRSHLPRRTARATTAAATGVSGRGAASAASAEAPSGAQAVQDSGSGAASGSGRRSSSAPSASALPVSNARTKLAAAQARMRELAGSPAARPPPRMLEVWPNRQCVTSAELRARSAGQSAELRELRLAREEEEAAARAAREALKGRDGSVAEESQGAGASESKQGGCKDEDEDVQPASAGAGEQQTQELEVPATGGAAAAAGSSTALSTNADPQEDVSALMRALQHGKARGGRPISEEEREANRLRALERFGTGSAGVGREAGEGPRASAAVGRGEEVGAGGCPLRVVFPDGVALRARVSPYERVGAVLELVHGALDAGTGARLKGLRGGGMGELGVGQDGLVLAETRLVPRGSIQVELEGSSAASSERDQQQGWYLAEALRKELATKSV